MDTTVVGVELGALARVRLYGNASARDCAAVERLGGVAIDGKRAARTRC